MDTESYRSTMADEVDAVLDAVRLPLHFRNGLRAYLAAPGRVLSLTRLSPWPLLPIICCRSASGGTWQQALPVAAAIEVFIAAADLLDDLQDGDTEWQVNAQSLQLLAALLFLPTTALLRLEERQVAPQKTIRVLRVFAQLAAQAGVGQFYDVWDGSGRIPTIEASLEISGLKAASLMQCACELGALVGSEDHGLVQAFGRFGWHTGLYAQLQNDLRDVSSDSEVKNDLRQGKKTVPIVFASAGPTEDFRAERIGAFLAQNPAVNEAEARRLLEDMGAIHFTWVLADVQRRLALGVLHEIEAGGHDVAELSSLFPSEGC